MVALPKKRWISRFARRKVGHGGPRGLRPQHEVILWIIKNCSYMGGVLLALDVLVRSLKWFEIVATRTHRWSQKNGSDNETTTRRTT